MIAFKIIIFIWPFLREWFLGDKTVMQALKQNKKSTATFFAFIILLLTCLFTVPRLYFVSRDYLALSRTYYILAKDCGQANINNQDSPKVDENGNVIKNVVLPPTILESVVQDKPPTTIIEPKIESNQKQKIIVPTVKKKEKIKPTKIKPSLNTERYDSFKTELEKIKENEMKNSQ